MEHEPKVIQGELKFEDGQAVVAVPNEEIAKEGDTQAGHQAELMAQVEKAGSMKLTDEEYAELYAKEPDDFQKGQM